MIKNLTGLDKIYFSTDLVQHEYSITGIMDGKYGELMFGKNEKYMFVAFGSYTKWVAGKFNGTTRSKGEIHKFAVVDREMGNTIYKEAISQTILKSKKGREYRRLDCLEKYFK